MGSRKRMGMAVLGVLGLCMLSVHFQAATYDASLMKGMKWRLIGPFRGGRALAVAMQRRPFGD